ncbi:MAG: hypothetical protein E6Q62_11150 [Nitrosomonas sp.]|nr:MAG: hypothetical protein E6Q62_11150 [Nitrosomonas sp.]
MKLSKHIALLYFASGFLLTGSSLPVFAAPPVMSVTGSVDANVTNNVKVINPDGGALEVHIQPKKSSYTLSLNATATNDRGSFSAVTIPFDSYISGINFTTGSKDSASCSTFVSYQGAGIPEGANTNEIAETGFASDGSRYAAPLYIMNSEYISIPHMFIRGGDELLLTVTMNTHVFGATGNESCLGRAKIYLIPAEK